MSCEAGSTLLFASAPKGDVAGALEVPKGEGALALGFSELGANMFCTLGCGGAAAAAGLEFSSGLQVNHFDDSCWNSTSSFPLFFVHSFSAPLARAGLKTWR